MVCVSLLPIVSLCSPCLAEESAAKPQLEIPHNSSPYRDKLHITQQLGIREISRRHQRKGAEREPFITFFHWHLPPHFLAILAQAEAIWEMTAENWEDLHVGGGQTQRNLSILFNKLSCREGHCCPGAISRRQYPSPEWVSPGPQSRACALGYTSRVAWLWVIEAGATTPTKSDILCGLH